MFTAKDRQMLRRMKIADPEAVESMTAGDSGEPSYTTPREAVSCDGCGKLTPNRASRVCTDCRRWRCAMQAVDQWLQAKMTMQQLGEVMAETSEKLTPHQQAHFRKVLYEKIGPNLAMNSQNRCRRSNGTLRAWFATAAEAVAFADNPLNKAYQGDVAVKCQKPSCGGWHLSQPDWPDARAAVNEQGN